MFDTSPPTALYSPGYYSRPHPPLTDRKNVHSESLAPSDKMRATFIFPFKSLGTKMPWCSGEPSIGHP